MYILDTILSKNFTIKQYTVKDLKTAKA